MTGRPRLLVVGPTGQVGHELCRVLARMGEVVTAGHGSLATWPADLDDAASLRHAVREARPAVVLNAAAHTGVDAAESEPEVALRRNALAPEALAEAARAVGALLVQYSTDYVFDGASQRPWRETDPTHPLSVYGQTKLEGERRVAASGALHLVLRSAWIYAGRGRNFLRTMKRLFAERAPVRVVNDQVGSPTWARALAEATRDVLARLAPLGGDLDPRAVSGLYHASCAGATSWFGFAQAIHARLAASCDLLPIPSSAYATRARRPAYSVLDGEKLRRTFGVRLPDWEVALARCLAEPE